MRIEENLTFKNNFSKNASGCNYPLFIIVIVLRVPVFQLSAFASAFVSQVVEVKLCGEAQATFGTHRPYDMVHKFSSQPHRNTRRIIFQCEGIDLTMYGRCNKSNFPID